MSTRTTDADVTASLGWTEILSDDGTCLQAWTNDPDQRIDGPTVLLCNGLGTGPYTWPALLDPDCGVRVVSWNHRGTGGSDRPVDPQRVGIEEFVEDALSVLDHFGLERVALMGWSMGVNTAFELALRHPERVAGIFAVAGVPGDTFATMLGPLHLPHAAARLLTVNLSRAMRLSGRALTPIAQRLPVGRRAMTVLTHTGFMFPMPDLDLAALAVKDFLETPVDWYFHLALKTSEHARVRLSRIEVPVCFVAGTYDVLAGARDMRTATARLSDASYAELRGSHFIQMEQPAAVHGLLLDWLDRIS